MSDLSNFGVYNPDQYYDNMLECDACHEETVAGNLQEMVQWATSHKLTCVPKRWYVECLWEAGTEYEYWRVASWFRSPLTDAECAEAEATFNTYTVPLRVVERKY